MTTQDHRQLDRESRLAAAGARAAALPADVPPTDLTSRPCRYWEVDVEAATDGVDYAARFLVPVY